MEPYFMAGRVLFGGFFILGGIDHFRYVSMMAPYAASKGVPAARLAVLGSGTMLLLGGVSILLGLRPTLGVIALTAFLLPITFTMHRFWELKDPQSAMAEAVNFKKNLALLGAAWSLLMIPQPWPMSLGW
jgi:uncharacterized membrane protein YphA (DoxX/SURF4 family)